MYSVSDAFLQAVESNSRKYYWSGTITTANGVSYPFENKDIVKGSGYITRQCCSSTEIETLPNAKETLGIYAENDMETWRDLLYYVAQVLGCVCLINREGKLQLVPYSNTAVVTIPQKERFSSSYSDFVTRYTAISSTNQLKEISEYYALDSNDALTMNLGINPLLQFGLVATRERILMNILYALSKVKYVPFDSSTIGNPAIDPMDVVQFTGGHADADKVSCITSITYNINGKHSLKCVGKNPKLSAAKSKNDKNITGLLNQVENNKTVVYSFMNVSPFTIGNSATEVLSITFTAKESTSAMFLGEFLLDVKADEVERTVEGTATYEESTADSEFSATIIKPLSFAFTDKGHPILTVTYKVNRETVATFIPTQTYLQGRQVLTLFYPMSTIIENSENTFDVYLSMEGGTINIGEAQIRATISGQGLVAGIGDWNGRIAITEDITRVAISQESFVHDRFGSSVAIIHPWNSRHNITQTVPRISITEIDFGYDLLNERVTATEVIKTFTVDATHPPHYDVVVVGIENDAFTLISDYAVVSAEEEINSGRLQHLTVDTTPFERVENMEVELC